MAINRKTLEKALTSWNDLNAVIMQCTSETEVAEILAAEQAGKNRRMFTLRIHSRLNKLRGQRERKELGNGQG